MRKLLNIAALGGILVISTNASPLGQPFSLRAGETECVDRGNLSLTFTGVTNDSRCPKGLDCLVPGEATVVITARLANGESAALTIKVPAGEGAASQFQGYRITIIKLEPYPEEGKRIEPADYTAKILVERLRARICDLTIAW